MKEQTISNLKKLKSFHNGSYGADINRAIQALEQQPCDDAVSRAELNALYAENRPYLATRVSEFGDKLKKLPSVTPSAQAWLSSFNTDSATECFTAVQELKKRLEGDTDADNN